MNTLEENRRILNTPAMRSLLARLESQRRTGRPLRYGFEAGLRPQDLPAAARLNSVYESMLWGSDDAADNNRLQRDERALLSRWLGNSVFNGHVLEVGAGSGRFSGGLLQFARRADLLDRERLVVNRLKQKLRASTGRAVRFLEADFGSPRRALPGDCEGYSSVFLIENLLGMNPEEAVRRRIILNASRSLLRGGIAVFGFRVRSDVRAGRIEYQAMPWQNIFGIAVNWSPGALEKEVRRSGAPLRLLEMIPGGPRPAGGRMWFGVFQRWD